MLTDNYFFDGDQSFISVTKGANISALSMFYKSLNGYTMLDNHIYGFTKNPLDVCKNNYQSLDNFIKVNNFDIFTEYKRDHLKFLISINPKIVDKNIIEEKIKAVCQKYK